MPMPLLGHVVPNSTTMPNARRSYVTNIPYGPPIIEQKTTAQPMAPKNTGDDKNPNILKALQNLMGKESGGHQASQKQSGGIQSDVQQKPISEAQEQFRDWRR